MDDPYGEYGFRMMAPGADDVKMEYRASANDIDNLYDEVIEKFKS